MLISPKESAGLTGVVEKAFDARIPVIVLDRNVDTKRITQFIGGDNVAIGEAAGDHAVKLLGGPGKAAGNVVEIWGGMGAQPAHDRHDGFHAFTDKEPGIKYLLNNQSGDWKQDKAYDIMTTVLRVQPEDRCGLCAQRPDGLRRISRREGCGPREEHQVREGHRRPAAGRCDMGRTRTCSRALSCTRRRARKD